METNELLRRAEDLSRRCERGQTLTMTGFLSPAERAQVELWARRRPGCRVCFSGGRPFCERTAAFFLPDWMEPEELDPAEHIKALELTAHFGSPGHRDYLGALLGMGVRREWLGDILVQGERAWVFCLNSVQRHLLGIEKVGRVAVTARAAALEEAPEPVRKVRQLRFSVMSPRLDAVAAGMFRLSRAEAARQIAAGGLRLNYVPCLKADAAVKEGDILSLHGAGKGTVVEIGGSSRKGRTFVGAEVLE